MTRGAASKSILRRVGIVAGFLALAAVPALGLSAFAAADTGTGATSGQPTPPAHPVLTDAQKQCLGEHGVTLPDRSTALQPGQQRTPPTAQQREALQQAAQACGLPIPRLGAHRPGGLGFGARPPLTDAQKQCLAGQGVTLPGPPADGTAAEPPSPPTAEQRAALRQAATACGITIRGPHLMGSAQDAAV